MKVAINVASIYIPNVLHSASFKNMAKLMILLSILAFQVADFASLQNVDFEKYLQEIKNEVRDLSMYLQTSFPDNHQAIDTVTWQCHRFAESIKSINAKVHEETLKHHPNGEKIFKQLWFTFQEIHTSLQQIALSTDVSVSEIKKQIIINLKLVCENLTKMVYATYNYYPEFRMTLNAILSSFINELRVIRRNFDMQPDVSLQHSPKAIAKDIRKFSQKIIYRLREFAQPDLIKGSLSWYLDNLQNIIQKLDVMKSVGDDEINVILRHLTIKCKKAARLAQEVTHYESSVNTSEIFGVFCDIVTLFEQLVQFIENGSQSEHADVFIQKIIYDYFYVIKHTFDMIQTGYEVNSAHQFNKEYQVGQGPYYFSPEHINDMSRDYFGYKY